MAYYSLLVPGVAREALTKEASCFVRGVYGESSCGVSLPKLVLEHYMKEPKKGDVVQAVTTESMGITVKSVK